MKKLKAYRADDWFLDCPECGEIITLGSREEAEEAAASPSECDCGHIYNFELDEAG